MDGFSKTIRSLDKLAGEDDRLFRAWVLAAVAIDEDRDFETLRDEALKQQRFVINPLPSIQEMRVHDGNA